MRLVFSLTRKLRIRHPQILMLCMAQKLLVSLTFYLHLAKTDIVSATWSSSLLWPGFTGIRARQTIPWQTTLSLRWFTISAQIIQSVLSGRFALVLGTAAWSPRNSRRISRPKAFKSSLERAELSRLPRSYACLDVTARSV